MEITFNDIFIHGHKVAEDSLLKQYHFPEMLTRYDSSFIEYKHYPTLEELKLAESYLRDYHQKHGQKHIKFKFPENERIPLELEYYLNQKGYDIGFLELYAIQPDQFPGVEHNPDIAIQQVTNQTLEAFLELQYQQDLIFGNRFANQKKELNKSIFQNPRIIQLMALYQGEPAGAVDLILSRKMVEIDNLGVLPSLQKKGIGSRIQKWVMDTFDDKTVILVADGQDTPRDMYQKQNYQCVAYQYYTQVVEV
ncbi:GNAT family N-acetyltransferase [Neobacillus sp. K501]